MHQLLKPLVVAALKYCVLSFICYLDIVFWCLIVSPTNQLLKICSGITAVFFDLSIEK